MHNAHRLRSAADFKRTFAEGRRGSAGAVLAVVRTSTEARAPRVGIASGRSVGTAVTRNRVKRRLRHIARARIERLAPGTDVVLVAKPQSSGRAFQDLSHDVDAALTRAGLA